MSTIDSFVEYAKGKTFDNTGAVNMVSSVQTSPPYAGQCVSLIQGYMRHFGCEVRARGNAIDWWNNFNSNGLSKYFTKVTSMPKDGDVVITNADPNFGHIGIMYHGLMLQQNYFYNPRAQLLGVTGSVYGYLRPNFLSSYKDSELINEHAYATIKYAIQKRRDTPDGMVVETLQAGKKLEYTQKWVGNGHRYISWVEHQADGASYRYFVAVNGNEAGTEPWADFSPIEDKKPETTKPADLQLTQEDGVATFTVDAVRARYDSPTGDVVRTFNAGDSVRYYWKYVGNGHRYVVYKEGNRKVFVAVFATEDKSQPWAKFSAPDESKPTTTPSEKPSTPSKPAENTNGFTYVNEGDYEGKDKADVVFEHDGVTVDLIDKDLYPYKCPYLINLKDIVIHNAATPNGTAKALNRALHNSKEYKSWHFSVDDKDIIQSLPLNRNAFATGDGAYGLGNRTGIHIEIAKDNDTDSREEWLEARDNGARLAAELLYKYGWGIDHLKKHQDYKMTDGTYKYCPHKILDEGWNEFKALVSLYLNELNNPKEDDSKEDKKPETKPDNKEEEDKTAQTSTLIALLIKLLQKILSFLK